MKTLLLAATLLGVSAPQPIVMPPNAIPWSPRAGSQFALLEGSMQGAGPYAFRIKFTAHGESYPEYHSSVDHVVVLAGTLYIGFGKQFDRKHMRALPAGSFIAVPRHVAHFTMAEAGTIIQVYGFGPRVTTDMNGRPK